MATSAAPQRVGGGEKKARRRARIVDAAAANDSQGTTDGSARAARPCIASATTSGDPISGSELGAAMATALALVRSAASSAAAGPATSHELEPSGRHILHQEAPERRERQPNPVELRYARLEAESRGLQWYSRPRGAAPYSEAAGTRGRRKVWNYLTGVFDDPPPLLATDDEQVSRLPHELRPSAPMMGPSERSLLQEALPPAVGLATPPAEEGLCQAKPVPSLGRSRCHSLGRTRCRRLGRPCSAGWGAAPQAGEDWCPGERIWCRGGGGGDGRDSGKEIEALPAGQGTRLGGAGRPLSRDGGEEDTREEAPATMEPTEEERRGCGGALVVASSSRDAKQECGMVEEKHPHRASRSTRLTPRWVDP